ncbi:arylsulfatase A-like enzyme [Tahibacter aquaticus]|uniref:Arylsulfatase A-like enzyme n=1 Tax=Tahibacter aquaticus TaxID=520092 RepID=A0A4R6Z2D7_9GAMM|nr:sulfatase-like hydrolase/transferase [Tahibacter aquaticus]TDR45768.1 arylsulfatase A-like enzyme [Tahibacter aquaticus]
MQKPTSHPNILLILVDQLRFPRFSYGPDGGFAPGLKDVIGFQGDAGGINPWRKFFPGFQALRQNAVVLRQHTIASSACIPSRAAIMTGQYGTRTGVTQTDGLFKNGDAAAFPWLAADGIPTLGHWFRAAGYRTHYFGKWHVSNPPDHSLQSYGFDDWELSWPEPHGSSINNLGVYRDVGYADLVCGFLRGQGLGLDYNRKLAQQDQSKPLGEPPATTQKPWLAVASFTNPHDIATYPALPRGVDPDGPKFGPLAVPAAGARSNPPTAGSLRVDLNPLGFPQENAQIAPSTAETLHNKPSCQYDYAYKMGLALASKTGLSAQEQAGLDAVTATLMSGIPFQLTRDPDQAAQRFLQYYAWLQHLVDGHIHRVLTALEESGQRENTVVMFLADHGEYGAAHNYMIEKWHTAYQEALHVPVVIQAPHIHSGAEPRQIDALTSHVDIVPTLLGLAGLGPQIDSLAAELRQTRPVPPFAGANLAPLIHNLSDTVHEADGAPRLGVLFATDDTITEPLSDKTDPHQLHSEHEFAVFLQAVEAVRSGDSRVPHNGPVPGLRPGPVRQPNHVRCVRSGGWKLSRYFDPSGEHADEWEMYNLDSDGNELTNLLRFDGAFPTPIDDLPQGYTAEQIRVRAEELHQLLRKLEAEKLSWPQPPQTEQMDSRQTAGVA